MANGRTENAAKMVGASMVQQLVVVLSGLILPRFFLKEYGSEINGLVNSIKQFLTYFSIVGAGVGIACKTALFRPLADKDPNEISKVLSATGMFFRKSGYFFAALLSVMLLIYPLTVEASLPFIEVASLILVLSFSSIIEYMALNKYRILLEADQKLYIEARIQTEGTVLSLIFTIVLIKLHYSVIVVQLVVIVIFLLRTYRVIFYVKKNYTGVTFAKKADIGIIPGRWSAFVYQVSSIINMYTPVILITCFCSLKAVSVYAIYNMVFAALLQIINTFSSGLSAFFGNIVVREDKNALLKSFRSFIFVFYCIGFSFYACAGKLILPFVQIYTKGINDINYYQPALAVLFVASGISTVVRTPVLTMIEATGRYHENVPFNVAEVIINMVVSVIATIRYGLSGVLLGITAAGLIRTILYIVFLNKKILGTNPNKMIITIVFNVFCVIIIALFPINIPDTGFIKWTLYAIIIFMLSFFIIAGTNTILDRKAGMDIITRIGGIVKKLSKTDIRRRVSE